MRDSIDLRLFNAGLVSNPDIADIPLEAQTEGSQNLDVEVQGKLQGIPGVTTYTSLGNGATNSAWINRNDGKWDLIYTNGTNIYVIYDFYGTPVQATLKSGYEAKTLVSNNQEVHIGCGTTAYPQWIGYISYGQFGGAATYASSLYVTNNSITAPSNIALTLSAATDTTSNPKNAVFPKGTEYEYAMSYVYDGYQESPLSNDTLTYQVTTFLSDIRIKAQIDTYATLNKRISGVKIYRRERPFFESTEWTAYEDYLQFIKAYNEKSPTKYKASDFTAGERYEIGSMGAWGEYKLVADIDINASSTTDYITSTGWITSGSAKYVIAKDTNKMGASYYSNVGISESFNKDITSYTLGHGLSTAVNNMMFIAQAAYGTLTSQEAAHMIFRSKPYRYDTFDQTNDRLILPIIPKAMKSHRGELWVWDENRTFIIDPIKFQIIKSLTGRGCASQQSLVETDYGLFWANKNGVYWSTQTEELIQPTKDNLTEPIKNQYQDAVGSYTPKLTYHSARNQLLVHLGGNIFAYNTVEKRWDYYPSYVSGTITGVFIGKDGETYTATSSLGIVKNFGSTITKSAIFISKEFTLDDPSQDKKFYKIIRDQVGAVTCQYSIDGGSTWVTASTENLGAIRAKTIMVKISIPTNSGSLDSLSILYRRLRGKR